MGNDIASTTADALKLLTGADGCIQLTLVQLRAIAEEATPAKLAEVLPHLNAGLVEARITSKGRLACALPQLLHECGEFRYNEEVASGAAYEGRKDLGNIHVGDGKRYKGRGWIMATGLNNYTWLAQETGIDFVGHPELASLPENCAKIFARFWLKHDLNALADKDDQKGITKKVNGACTDGAPSYFLRRKAYHDKILKVLG
jgi:predicted chitinase